MQNHWLFSSNNIYFCKCRKADEKEISKEDEQTLEQLNSAHRRSQAKRQLIQTSYIKRIKLFLFSPYNKHLYLLSYVGLYGRILTSVVCTDLTAFGLYLRPRSRFSHTDLQLG